MKKNKLGSAAVGKTKAVLKTAKKLGIKVKKLKVAKFEPKDVSGIPQPPEPLFVVRLYDGFDYEWMDVSKAVTKAEAEVILAEKTGNGTHNTSYSNIDYYRIFPADTKMLYSDGYMDHLEWKARQENE